MTSLLGVAFTFIVYIYLPTSPSLKQDQTNRISKSSNDKKKVIEAVRTIKQKVRKTCN